MSPAVKMAEIQQVELPVVLRVVDGVHVLEDTQRGDRDTRDGYVNALPLLSGGLLKAESGGSASSPTALPPCSRSRCSRRAPRRSRRSLLKEGMSGEDE